MVAAHNGYRCILIGPPGAGKTTFGQGLAKQWGVPFRDTDDDISDLFQHPCGEVFTILGEKEFRRAEERLVQRAVKEHHGVLALGGGAVLSAHTRRLLRSYPTVFLKISPEEAVQRTSGEDTRPILDSDSPLEHYRQLLRRRHAYYEDCATLTISTEDSSPEELYDSVTSHCEEYYSQHTADEEGTATR